MALNDIPCTSCAFIPVYCYYNHQNREENKTPVLLVDSSSFLLKAIIISIDPSIYTQEELKDQFLEAYYRTTKTMQGNLKALDHYDIYPQLVTTVHTDEEEISVYICELYENSEPYFKKSNRSQLVEYVSYKEGIDDLLKSGVLEPLTEKLLVALSEDGYISRAGDTGNNSIEFF